MSRPVPARKAPVPLLPHLPVRLLGMLAVLTLVATGCVGRSAVDPSAGNATRYIAGSGAVTRLPKDARQPPAEVSGQLLGGGSLDLRSLRGHVVVLNFWASWCPPCRDEATGLQGVYDATRGQGVRFVGINIKDHRAAADAFVRVHKITYPSILDQPGRVALAFRGTLPPTATPSTLVLDASGRVAARVIGPVTYSRLLALVRSVLAEVPA